MQTLSHALAKAAMFLALGLVAESLRARPHGQARRRGPGDAGNALALLDSVGFR
jgi:NADH:ubiquinone oxidoreductase subunit 5 (subunit L)/multisubunit Na+/H+ antiporter MnhA subunit